MSLAVSPQEPSFPEFRIPKTPGFLAQCPPNTRGRPWADRAVRASVVGHRAPQIPILLLMQLRVSCFHSHQLITCYRSTSWTNPRHSGLLQRYGNVSPASSPATTSVPGFLCPHFTGTSPFDSFSTPLTFTLAKIKTSTGASTFLIGSKPTQRLPAASKLSDYTGRTKRATCLTSCAVSSPITISRARLKPSTRHVQVGPPLILRPSRV